MLPDLDFLRRRLVKVLDDLAHQGHDVQALQEELRKADDSYDAFAEIAAKAPDAPMREDWPYVEPDGLEEIRRECDPDRPAGWMADMDPEDAARRAKAAFLGAVAGCVLGKPLEIMPTLEEIRDAAEQVGEWPLDDYISEEMLEALGRRHASWPSTCRGRIEYVAPDDDIRYTVLGMLLVEEHGTQFTRRDVMNLWIRQLPPVCAWGPERTMLARAGTWFAEGNREDEPPFEEWVRTWNPHSELCGATIRADAFGYAAAGNPALAAEMAWRDAGWTHRRTGIYGEMFVAAAIAAAFVADEFVADDPLQPCRVALQFVPQRSRFHKIVSDCLRMVEGASDWLEGYEKIHAAYGEYGHCQVYQECGTLINTMRFAEDVGHGICIQVAQGNDTDCFGEIAGSLLGAYLGPGHLEERWLEPFNDEIRTGLASFYDRSLSSVADRMADLPRKVLREEAGVE